LSGARKRGRPPLTDEVAQQKAEYIIWAGWALRYAPTQFKGAGMTDEQVRRRVAQARRLVHTRHRGRVGELIGDSLDWVRPHYSRHHAAAQTAAELLDGGITRAAALAAAIRWHEGNTGRVPGVIDPVVTLDRRTVRRYLNRLRPT
jgi:hypothetical protein